MHTFTERQDFYRVTLNVDPDKTDALIDAAREFGVQRVFIVRARGVLHRRKVGLFRLPSISPSLDVLHFLVPEIAVTTLLAGLIRVGHLDHFGAGSVYASRVDRLWVRDTELYVPTGHEGDAGDVELQRDLVAIQCICQLEHADEIAREAMLAGSPSPTVCYGYGHGIRDKLGPFLQLTINPKKEFIELVVGSAEAPRIFEKMVEAGHLDRPAQGFISTRPVELGLINSTSYHASTEYPATMEQIIKAIDQLQGNTLWRSSGTLQSLTGSHRKKLKDLVSLSCIVDRGLGDPCSWAAMEAGASGTSTYFANAVPQERPPTHEFDLSDEREIITLSVGAGQVEPVVKAIAALPELVGKPLIFFTNPAPEAVTYLG